MNILIWVYNVNTLQQNYYPIYNGKQAHIIRAYNIDDGLDYLKLLINLYNPTTIRLQGGDIHSQDYAEGLKMSITNKIMGEIDPLPSFEVVL